MPKYRSESIRLKNWDYSRGAYFVTICVKEREHVFGNIVDGKMCLNDAGRTAWNCWREISDRFNVAVDEYVIMPNHMHGVLLVNGDGRNTSVDAINGVSTLIPCHKNPMITFSLGTVIRWYKGRVTFEINKLSDTKFQWQSGYYDRVIRDELECHDIRKYLVDNSLKWDLDRNNTENLYM